MEAYDSLLGALHLSGNFHECRPLFLDKSAVLLCASGSTVQAISSKTGELIGSFRCHNALVTCIARCEIGDNVVSASIDGDIIVWNASTFQRISQLAFPAPVYDIVIPLAAEEGDFITGRNINKSASSKKQKSDSGDTNVDGDSGHIRDELYLAVGRNFDTESGRVDKQSIFKFVVYDTRVNKVRRRLADLKFPRACTASMGSVLGENYIVTCSGRKIYFLSATAKSGPSFSCTNSDITCVAVKENDGLIITGHESGEILVWHDALAWLQAACAAEAGNVRGNVEGEGEGDNGDADVSGKKKSKSKALRIKSHPSFAAPTSTTLHWHAHPVVSMSLSGDGRYLYSGGEEGVLVVWQLATGFKDFVPRLGAAITHVAASSLEPRVAVTSMDNSVRIVNISSMKEDWELRSLCVPTAASIRRRAAASEDNATSSIAQTVMNLKSNKGFIPSDIAYRCQVSVEARSGYLACNGYPGQLQIFDIATQTFRCSHEIVQYTRVSKREAYTQMYVPSVTHFEFAETALGDIMATVDVRRGEESEAEGSLKLWQWDVDRSRYRLSAQVDRPHGPCRVTSLALSTSGLGNPGAGCSCATAATDGSIKIWVARAHHGVHSLVPQVNDDEYDVAHGQGQPRRNRSNSISAGLHWTCAFSFKHRETPVNALKFSVDGSVLAVASQNMVTLWDPSRVKLCASVVNVASYPITYVSFIEPRYGPNRGGGNGQALLVIGTKRSLSVYDLITLDHLWTIRGRFTAFTVSASEDQTIAFRTSSTPVGDGDGDGDHAKKKEKSSKTPSKSKKNKTDADEAPAVVNGAGTSAVPAPVAWIAAAVEVEGGDETETETGADSVKDGNGHFDWKTCPTAGESTRDYQYKVAVFNPFIGKPLRVHGVSTRVTSLAFWENSRSLSSFSLSSGLVVVTEGAEVLLMGPSGAIEKFAEGSKHGTTGAAATHASKEGLLKAKILGKFLPSLDVGQTSSSSAGKSTDDLPSLQDLQRSDIATSSLAAGHPIATGTSKGWLHGLFDSRSDAIAPVSAIYDGFMGQLLAKKEGNAKTAVDATTTTAAAPVSQSKDNNQPTALQTSGVDNVVIDDFFGGERASQFQESLASFFSASALFNDSNGAQSSAKKSHPVPAVASTPSTKKKRDRDEDAEVNSTVKGTGTGTDSGKSVEEHATGAAGDRVSEEEGREVKSAKKDKKRKSTSK